MCFFDNVRYICSGEEQVLVERCPAAGHRCVPHIRQVLFSTSVCELCGAAWEQSALTEEAYNEVVTPMIESGDQTRDDAHDGYFPANAVFAAPSPTSSSCSEQSFNPSEMPTSLEEIAEGVFNMDITTPMLEVATPKGKASRRTTTAHPRTEVLWKRHDSHLEDYPKQQQATETIALSDKPQPRRHSH